MAEPTSAAEAHILVVNQSETDASLLREFLESEGYQVSTVTSLASFDTELDDPAEFRLALIDADGFSPSLWDRCERLESANIPFLILSMNPGTVMDSAGPSQTKSIEEKPIQKEQLLDFITSMTD